MNKAVVLILLGFVIFSCSKESELFTNPDIEKTGVSFQNTLTATEDMNILDYLYFYNGGGLAIGDINNDGLPDIYFSGNQVKNQLYLNKGGLQFENITETAGVAGNSDWNTGAVMADINGDGLLDIYVCAVVGLNGLDGNNELFINNGDGTFTERAAEYGLDLDTFSSSAAFLDYDLDGDLDIYILNHAVHTQTSFGKADLRYKRNAQTGDRLMRNDGDHFTDVSEEAGIYGGMNSYGLGIAVSDFNLDGYPDIYIGNDFHEDDYYYINNGDGTFTEALKEHFGHTSRFSMGSDVADLNHDGWPDLISLDMLPQDEEVLKSSEGDDNIQTQRLRTNRYGYHYQFTRNMLFINREGGDYQETALLSGVAATDWSWSALFGDYNQDMEQDLFISNGIPKRPNDLDYIKFVSSDQIQSKINNTHFIDQKALDMMPSGATHNYVYEGSSNLIFKDQSGKWITNDTIVSGATAYADLDNDGDLDLLTNNINAAPTFYINQINQKANYLKLKLSSKSKNNFAIGAKVYTYTNGIKQFKELYPVRGFQASSEPLIHFGLGQEKIVDSIRIIWPDNTSQKLTNIKANQTLKVNQEGTQLFNYANLKPKKELLFTAVTDSLGLDFVHKEDAYSDFDREKLIPYQIGDRGPAVAQGDLDGDGKEDLFFGGSKYITSQVYLKKEATYQRVSYPAILNDSINEEVTALIADFNQDGKNDLMTGTAGGDFFNRAKPLVDGLYLNKTEGFEKSTMPELFDNTSVLATYDYDNDGDLDVFAGTQTITGSFGKTPVSYLLENNKGSFRVAQEFKDLGMVTAAVWDDFNGDGVKDLIVVGEWMAPTFLKNKNGRLTKIDVGTEELNGLWQSIIPFDIDGDGDTDYIVGNWGENSKFKASEDAPMLMYYNDFDKNGQTETIVTTAKDGKYYPLMGLDALASQVVSLKKKYHSYKDFAGQTIEQILTEKQVKTSKKLEVNTLETGYLRNENGRFTFIPLGYDFQVAPVLSFCKFDFDNDGKDEILAAGNYFGVQPFHGRLDSFGGVLIKNADTFIPGDQIGLDFTQKSIRHLNILSLKGQKYLLATPNNAAIQLYKLKN
ncbi:VCBS repeat-containing protein [Leeuwenhoekiella marinoflava]|uniref:VCBS repeat protein n=2 Tax=Leeuwenhoekiella marinoflava TaxID=988 RepID=A0A4Q0PKY6_9FLAO|nr:VCBS repeat-containing protein [Leeuwenhoekiella marinoflava]RXG27412.1 VCBS repeat protein [Leeuwenhoekiella marinoflava]SHF69783.1 Repeat domain-containing protein [Leeuwenhoekiella marinoflava DSM 3653]